jgi:WD40 repeat protein
MTEPRHYLITVGVSEYECLGEDDELKSAADDVRAITELFCTDLGYARVLQDIVSSPRATNARRRLSAWLVERARKPNDRVVIYWSGHGEVGPDGRHYLLCRDFDGQNYTDKAVATEDIARMLVGTPVSHLLLMLDTCYAGAGITDFSAMQGVINRSRANTFEGSAGMYLVAASRSRDIAEESVFSGMFVDAVNAQRHGGWRQPALDPISVVGAINERIASDGRRQRVVINLVGSGGGISPVLRNPRYEERIPDGTSVEDGRRLLRRPDLLAHWSPRARGVGLQTDSGDFFEGRHSVLRAVVSWLDEPKATGSRIITGGPGSGKSAVLARLALLSDPQYRATLDTGRAPADTLPQPGAVDIAIHARGKTVADVTQEVADALDSRPVVAMIVEAAAECSKPPVMLVDALDEALDPRGLAREVLRPLSESACAKFIIGTRKHVIPALRVVETDILDLDDPSRWLDPDDVARYVDRLLGASSADGKPSPYSDKDFLRATVAKQVARRAQATFLIARLVARSLAERPDVIDLSDQTWIARLPSTVGEAFEEWLDRFDDDKPRVRDLLRPLAYANGGGLPWEDIWPPTASAIAGKQYGDADVEWLLEVGGAFVIETRQAERSAYRLFHEALAEHLRPAERERINQARIATVLEGSVPVRDGRREWQEALDYVRTHLATHAADGDAIDALLQDPGYLVAAEPTRLLRALGSCSEESAGIRTAYLSAFHMLPGSSALERASYLELYAQRHLVDDLARQIDAHFQARPWRSRWAKLRADSEHFVPGRHAQFVSCVATSMVNGRSIAVSGGSERTLRLWDLDARAPTGRQPAALAAERSGAYRQRISTVGFTNLNGTRVIVSNGWGDAALHIWDPETGDLLGTPIEDLGDSWSWTINSGADHVLVVLTRNGERGVEEQRVEMITGLDDVFSVESFLRETLSKPDGLLRCGDQVFAVMSKDGNRRLFELESGEEVGPELPGPRLYGMADVAGTSLNGCPVVGTVDEAGVLSVVNIESGKQIIRPAKCGIGALSLLCFGTAGDTDIAVVADTEYTMRVLDLRSGKPVGGSIAGHTARITSLAIGELDGRAIIVSGSDDKTIRVWDVHAGLETTPPPADFPGAVRAVALGRAGAASDAIFATVGRDAQLRLGRVSDGHALSAAVKLDGIPEAASLHVGEDRTIVAAGTTKGIKVFSPTQGTLRPIATYGADERCRGLDVLRLDGNDAFIAGRDRWVWRYGVDKRGSGSKAPTAGHEGGVTALAVAISRNRPLALSGGGEGTLLLWDIETGCPMGPAIPAHTGIVTAVAFADPDSLGVAVSAGSDGLMTTWDLGNLGERGPSLEGHTDWVRSIAFGYLGTTPVIVSGGDDYTVRLWTPRGELLRTIMLSTAVRTIAMDGTTAVIGTDVGLLAIDFAG